MVLKLRLVVGDNCEGSKGTMAMPINPEVEIEQEDNVLTFAAVQCEVFAGNVRYY